MGHRLSKIYTRTGDEGVTGISGNVRLAKDDARIEVMGDVDELNSAIGVVIALLNAEHVLKNVLLGIQQQLFNLGGELSLPEGNLITAEAVLVLEKFMDEWNSQLPYLREFIMPGGHHAAAQCHLARAICRRAERR